MFAILHGNESDINYFVPNHLKTLFASQVHRICSRNMIPVVFNQVFGMFILLNGPFWGSTFISHNAPFDVTLKQVASDETIAILCLQ